jgi:hypothetical protein
MIETTIHNLMQLDSAIRKNHVLQISKVPSTWEIFDINSYGLLDTISLLSQEKIKSLSQPVFIEKEYFTLCESTKNCLNYTRELSDGRHFDLAINMSIIDTNEDDINFTIIFYIQYINGSTRDFSTKDLLQFINKYKEMLSDSLYIINPNLSFDIFNKLSRIDVDTTTTIFRSSCQ